MARARPNLGTPYGTDGPWLAALLDVVSDLYDLLDARLPEPATAGVGEPASGAVPVSEPARQRRPAETVPVTEPATPATPDGDEDDDGKPAEVSEPVKSLPPPPPRAGRGSGLSAWQAFASIAEVTYSDRDGRDDIIAACIRAGVIKNDQQ